MSIFIIESEDFGAEELNTLSEALSPLAESDCPLLLELSLVEEEQIRLLNKAFRNTDKVTDVLSFPALENIRGKRLLAEEHPFETEEGKLFLGSIAICSKRAEEQAKEYGHSYKRELYYLAVHGVLHCLGYDHETEEEKREMREKEESVMKTLSLTRD